MRKLENKRLDEMGKMLVKAGTIPSREIDAIVADPALFEEVRKRIPTTEQARPARRHFLRPVTVGFAVAVFAVVATFAIVSLRSGGSKEVVDSKPSQPLPVKEPARKSSQPDQIASSLPPEEPVAKVERTSARNAVVRTPRPKQPTPQQARFVDDFYAVSYAGDPHETERGGRIVRVDIPRSTLFAMGINVPLENESATVKADLLIGSDGVTRAIRVVE
jgi:hypothetical protein